MLTKLGDSVIPCVTEISMPEYGYHLNNLALLRAHGGFSTWVAESLRCTCGKPYCKAKAAVLLDMATTLETTPANLAIAEWGYAMISLVPQPPASPIRTVDVFAELADDFLNF